MSRAPGALRAVAAGRRPRLAHPRFAAFLAVFVLAGGAAATAVSPGLAMLIGFDAGAVVYILSTAPLWTRGDAAFLRARAQAENAGGALLLGLAALAALATLAGLGLLAQERRAPTTADIGLTVATLALAWTFVNLVYAFHYAGLYYAPTAEGPAGGLEFPGTAAPGFSDFCYFAFVIGMTFQVSDVAITATRLRRVATGHAALAFFFNIGVLSLTVNVVAGAL